MSEVQSGNFSPETLAAIESAKELTGAVMAAMADEWQGMSEDERAWLAGRITGMILFEGALAVGTVGTANAVSAAAKAGKFAHIATKLESLFSPGTASKILNALETALKKPLVANAPIRGAGAADDLVIDSYGVLRRRSDIPGQAHHLNQDAAFRSRIAQSEGVSVKLEGNAFTDVGTPHYNAHESMESFWDIYRRGGMDAGNLPTNSQYNRALYVSVQQNAMVPSVF